MNSSRSPFAHPGLVVGSGCLVLSIGPLLLFVLLQAACGAFPGNNGLGLGLWFALSAPFAGLALVIGLVVDSRRKRTAAPTKGDHTDAG